MFDNDSRKAALSIYQKLRLGWIFNTSTFIGNVVLAAIVTYLFMALEYDDGINFVFFLSVLSIGLWITEAIPPFAVGIFIIAALLVGFGTDYIIDDSAPAELFLGTWTSNVIWLLLGGFFLAEGMTVAGLDQSLFRFTVRRFGSRPDRLLLGLMMMTALGSMVMSNTATTAMMISSVLPLLRNLGKGSTYTKALLIGIPAAASVGGIGTILGSTPNAIAVGALQEKGIYISFIQWMAVGFPLAIVLVFLFWKFLVKGLDIAHLQLNLLAVTAKKEDPNVFNRRAVIVTLVITIGMWLTEALHGLPLAATSAIPIVLLTLTQVIDAPHVRKLPWDTLMLVAGGLALGIALVNVGLADIIMEQLNDLPLPTFGLAIIFSLVAVLLSNVMSNTAAASILVPLGLSLPAPYSLAVPVIVAISCSCSLLLPVSTPSNAIAYATGMVEQKDFRRGGFFFILLGPLAALLGVALWVWLLF
jgi:solute carrier family 13 (sodium-dependent dicarboxylate transporter), member 2/3/5